MAKGLLSVSDICGVTCASCDSETFPFQTVEAGVSGTEVSRQESWDSETIRWLNSLADPQLEEKRIALYKARRRERYEKSLKDKAKF